MNAATASLGGTRRKFSVREAGRLLRPKEHGSWSLAFEPVALGLLVAPSRAGLALALAAGAGFFLRRPVKVLLQAKADPRRPLAALCAGVLLGVSLAALLLAARPGGISQLWPLLPAVLAGAGFVWGDARNDGREGAAELAGAAAFGWLPATFATLAGWPAAGALALAAVMLARSVPTVLLIRTLLRRKKGQPVTTAKVWLATALAAGISVWLAGQSLVPQPVTAVSILLLARAAWYLAPARFPLAARPLGFLESGLGVVFVLTAALAWHH